MPRAASPALRRLAAGLAWLLAAGVAGAQEPLPNVQATGPVEWLVGLARQLLCIVWANAGLPC